MVRIFFTPDMCLGSLNKGWTTPVGRERSQTAPSVGHARKTLHWLPPNFVVAGEYVATCSTTPLTGVDFRHIYHVLLICFGGREKKAKEASFGFGRRRRRAACGRRLALLFPGGLLQSQSQSRHSAQLRCQPPLTAAVRVRDEESLHRGNPPSWTPTSHERGGSDACYFFPFKLLRFVEEEARDDSSSRLEDRGDLPRHRSCSPVRGVFFFSPSPKSYTHLIHAFELKIKIWGKNDFIFFITACARVCECVRVCV